jgi:hypothetical protein
MPAYHQMGHDSWNLVDEPGLQGYRGIILSPVNCTPEQTGHRLEQLGKVRDPLDVILDPQLYRPNSDRGQLPEWPHFSDEFETVDLGNENWWTERCEYLVGVAHQLGANSIASPALVAPRGFNDEYYEFVAAVAELLAPMCAARGISPLLTAIVDLPQLGAQGAPERIATFLTRPSLDRIYLVINDSKNLKEQRNDDVALAGACRLIRLLEAGGQRVLVSFSGIDMVLWKSAGASNVASGKYFNLRRFVPGRWDDTVEGGRVVPYWTDEVLLTWLREQDLRVLLRAGLIDAEKASVNPYSSEILRKISGGQPTPWVGTAWRQYMKWFLDTEELLNANPAAGGSLLKDADSQWARIEAKELLLADRSNNGAWIRAWINALALI